MTIYRTFDNLTGYGYTLTEPVSSEIFYDAVEYQIPEGYTVGKNQAGEAMLFDQSGEGAFLASSGEHAVQLITSSGIRTIREVMQP